MKSLFKNKSKGKQKIKSISYSYYPKPFENNFKIKKQDISFKQKITDQAIINSLRNYSAFKSYIYAREQQEKNNIKKEKMENENINNLKTDLNYTNLLHLFTLVRTKYNPFKYNIKKKQLEIEKQNKNKYQNKIKDILLRKMLYGKNITSKIDSGLKKDLELANLYKKIYNYKEKYEKIKLLNEKKLGSNSSTTRENNKSIINIIKKFNKSNSFIINNSNYLKYNNNFFGISISNSETINEKKKNNESLSYEPSTKNLIKFDNDKINTERKLYKSKSQAYLNNISEIKKINKKYLCNDNKIIKKHNKFDIQNKNSKLYVIKPNKKLLNSSKKKNINSYSAILNESINRINKKPKFEKIIQKKINEKGHKNYISNIEDIFREYNKIKSNSDRLKMDYKMWHFSKYRDIDEIVDIKEDMLLFLLKQKYFRNKNNLAKSQNLNYKQNKSVIEIIKDDFNRIEDE